MKTSSEDPLASASRGVARATIDWTEEKIGKFVAKFHDKDIAFIEDPETINTAKKQRKTSEWNVFREYIDDTDLRIQFLMGLTLRKMAKQGKSTNILSLRDKILDKYGIKGLYVAQIIQNGFFSKFLGNVLERASTPQRLKYELENLFKNVENTVVFVKETDNKDMKIAEILAKILAHSPSTFVICGSGYAQAKCYAVKGGVMARISGYDYELYQAKYKSMYFLNKTEESLQQQRIDKKP